MDRRKFIISSLQASTAFGLLQSFPSLSFALNSVVRVNQKSPFFITIVVDGGWDTTLATDPWTGSKLPNPEDAFIEYRSDQIVQNGSVFLGPAMVPLLNYVPRMSIINGMFMSPADNGHPALQLYAESGNGQGRLPSLAVSILSEHSESPYGVCSSGGLVTMGQSSVWDISEISSSISGTASASDSIISPGPIGQSSTPVEKAIATIQKFGDREKTLKDLLVAYVQKLPSGSYLRPHHAISAAFKSGLSASARLSSRDLSSSQQSNLDTHAEHIGTHQNNLKGIFEGIKTLLDFLASEPGVDPKKSLLDETTIMITSEFSRTSALNGAKGKDHNPYNNSAIVMGPGIKGGMQIGGSHLVTKAQSNEAIPYFVAAPIDLKTEKVALSDIGTRIIRPENVIVTVLESMGLDPLKISSKFKGFDPVRSALK